MKGRRLVYRWVNPGADPRTPPTVLPALRVCADALVDWWAATANMLPNGHVSVRTGSLYAWPRPQPPRGGLPEPSMRMYRLKVASDLVFVGDVSVLGSLLTVTGWRSAFESLREHNVSQAEIDEEIGFIQEISNLMHVSAGPPAIDSLPSPMRGGLLKYFAEPMTIYLKGLQLLSDFDLRDSATGTWEVVIPAGRIHTVSIDTSDWAEE